MAINSALLAIITAKVPPTTELESEDITAQKIYDAMVAIGTEIAAKSIASIAVTGDGTTKTLTMTRGDGSTLTAEFTVPAGGGEDILPFYFGTLPDTDTPTEGEVEALTAQDVPEDGAKVIQFTNSTDAVLAFAYPATEPDPTDYYIGPLDNGSLGSGGTFAAPVTVGAYRVIISNYATQIPDPVTFS